MTADEVRDVLDQHGGTVDVANLNTPTQTVVSGPRADIDALTPVFAASAEAAVRLRVGGAFHSRQMNDAAARFSEFTRRYHFGCLRIPVVSNVSARPHADGEIADLLVRQLVEPVRWTDSMRYLLDQPEPEFHEIGPGHVLAGLIRQVDDRARERVA
jgi:malonyl CoA-acyl carrier protein transacylase